MIALGARHTGVRSAWFRSVIPRARADAQIAQSYEDFVNFPDDGKRHEIIDGEHYVTPSPNTKHQTVSLNLTVMIGMHLKGKIYRRVENAFVKIAELSAEHDDVLTTPLLPGWSVPLAEVFASPT